MLAEFKVEVYSYGDEYTYLRFEKLPDDEDQDYLRNIDLIELLKKIRRVEPVPGIRMGDIMIENRINLFYWSYFLGDVHGDYKDGPIALEILRAKFPNFVNIIEPHAQELVHNGEYERWLGDQFMRKFHRFMTTPGYLRPRGPGEEEVYKRASAASNQKIWDENARIGKVYCGCPGAYYWAKSLDSVDFSIFSSNAINKQEVVDFYKRYQECFCKKQMEFQEAEKRTGRPDSTSPLILAKKFAIAMTLQEFERRIANPSYTDQAYEYIRTDRKLNELCKAERDAEKKEMDDSIARKAAWAGQDSTEDDNRREIRNARRRELYVPHYQSDLQKLERKIKRMHHKAQQPLVFKKPKMTEEAARERHKELDHKRYLQKKLQTFMIANGIEDREEAMRMMQESNYGKRKPKMTDEERRRKRAAAARARRAVEKAAAAAATSQ